MEKCSLTELSKQISVYGENILLEISSSTFANSVGVALTGAAVTCLNCPEMSVTDSVFRNLTAVEGGAIYLEQQVSSKVQNLTAPSYVFSRNSFILNKATKKAGALYLGNPQKILLNDN